MNKRRPRGPRITRICWIRLPRRLSPRGRVRMGIETPLSRQVGASSLVRPGSPFIRMQCRTMSKASGRCWARRKQRNQILNQRLNQCRAHPTDQNTTGRSKSSCVTNIGAGKCQPLWNDGGQSSEETMEAMPVTSVKRATTLTTVTSHFLIWPLS